MSLLGDLFGKSKSNDFPMLTYLTLDGKDIYKFSIHPRTDPDDDGYEIDIHKQPSYRGRKQAQTIAHWLDSNRDSNRRMICFTFGKYPSTKEVAVKFAAQWSEMTSCYIKTGITIDDQILRLQ